MARETGIKWCRSTFNSWIGCTEVSDGCTNCYARELDKRHRYGDAVHWGAGVPRYRTSENLRRQPLRWNEDAAWERENGRLKNPSYKWHRPGFWPVFCASLADVFDNEVPEEWRADLWLLIDKTPNLTWLLLTKRIGNAQSMLPRLANLPDRPIAPWLNVWLGASVVNQEEADRDIPKLLATPAVKRFVSYEPALGPVDFSRYMWPVHWSWDAKYKTPEEARAAGAYAEQKRQALLGAHVRLLDWIIVGGESSQGSAKARPFDLAWARSTVAQCKAAGVACFVKQLGSAPYEIVHDGIGSHVEDYRCKDRAGADPAEWQDDIRVQEFPA